MSTWTPDEYGPPVKVPPELRRLGAAMRDTVEAKQRAEAERGLRQWAIEKLLAYPIMSPSCLFDTADAIVRYITAGEHPKDATLPPGARP